MTKLQSLSTQAFSSLRAIDVSGFELCITNQAQRKILVDTITQARDLVHTDAAFSLLIATDGFASCFIRPEPEQLERLKCFMEQAKEMIKDDPAKAQLDPEVHARVMCALVQLHLLIKAPSTISLFCGPAAEDVVSCLMQQEQCKQFTAAAISARLTRLDFSQCDMEALRNSLIDEGQRQQFMRAIEIVRQLDGTHAAFSLRDENYGFVNSLVDSNLRLCLSFMGAVKQVRQLTPNQASLPSHATHQFGYCLADSDKRKEFMEAMKVVRKSKSSSPVHDVAARVALGEKVLVRDDAGSH